jgi:hypothetical protein
MMLILIMSVLIGLIAGLLCFIAFVLHDVQPADRKAILVGLAQVLGGVAAVAGVVAGTLAAALNSLGG